MAEDTEAPDDSADEQTTVEVGDRYRRTDDGTTFEVVGITDDEVDIVQYTDDGNRAAEYTTSIEEFRREIAGPAQ